MSITLTPEQQSWIEAHVAGGEFASVEEAARRLIDDRIAELELEGDDLEWLKPHVEEAIAAADRGEVVTLDEHEAYMAALLASFQP